MTTEKRLYVKPKEPGMALRDPRTKRQLPDEGGSVPNTTFWRRRLINGDVLEVKPPKAKRSAAAKSSEPTAKAPQDAAPKTEG